MRLYRNENRMHSPVYARCIIRARCNDDKLTSKKLLSLSRARSRGRRIKTSLIQREKWREGAAAAVAPRYQYMLSRVFLLLRPCNRSVSVFICSRARKSAAINSFSLVCRLKTMLAVLSSALVRALFDINLVSCFIRLDL